MVIWMSYLIIFITIAYASLASLTQSNFTVIGNQEGYFWYFFLWTLIVATYFFYYTAKVFKAYHFILPYQKLISYYIYFACLLTPIIPYTENNPLLDDLHVFLAISSSICFLGVWICFLWHVKQMFPITAKKIELPFWMIIQTLILCLFFFGHINSVIEVILVISLALLIEVLLKNQKK